jgi:hypothetical protein
MVRKEGGDLYDPVGNEAHHRPFMHGEVVMSRAVPALM